MKFIHMTLTLCILIGFAGCNPLTEEQENKQAHQQQSAQPAPDLSTHEHSAATHTIVKQAGDVQVSFDISTMEAHHKMMQDMNMPMNHGNNTSHYVMVTLMDQDKNLLKEMPIKIKALGPDGKSLGDESGIEMETMSGNGMYHYGHGFDFASPGKYQILVMFKHGDQILSTGTEWEKK